MTQSHPTSDLTLIFDLDGTLVDTAPDILTALNHSLEEVLAEPIKLGQVRDMVGFGSAVLIRDALEYLGVPFDQKDEDRLRDKFIAFYVENVANSSALFPGVDTLLSRHKEAGTRLGVCTNKLHEPSVKLLKALDAHDHFHTIVGRDTFAYQKPDPRTLLDTIRQAGGTPERTVYLGDSITDVKTAKAANIPCVLVSFGYTNQPVESLGGDVVIDHFDELDSVVEQLLG